MRYYHRTLIWPRFKKNYTTDVLTGAWVKDKTAVYMVYNGGHSIPNHFL